MDEQPQNALANEPSPFLQHGARQPVRWQPWSAAAFELARRTDRPVLLDIGAVWCHWCHVMDRESYEDPDVALLINELFVPVKVDRDERPDVDARYQRAVQLLTGQGGWPLTAFLTPEGEVFYGGTYFPPRDAQGRPSFGRVLQEIARLWRDDRQRAREAARSVGERLTTYAEAEVGKGALRPELVGEVTEELARTFDFRYGGFGGAPKFPNPGGVDLLIDEWLDGGEPWTRRMFEETLLAMARGGIYDQLGGGFHRYATDARWIIPHFEKMAYDNGPLLATYARAFAATGEPRFRDTCAGIVQHYHDIAPELLAAGGFPASQDADVGPDDDGNYWTWTRAEVLAALAGAEELAELALRHWGVDADTGKMHLDPERHVLFEAVPAERIAASRGTTETNVWEGLAHARTRLLAARSERPRPFVDQTRYSGWVALVASGFLAAARFAGCAAAREPALRAVERLLADTSQDRAVPHRMGDPVSGELLDDQAFLVQALLDAFELTQQQVYLEHARRQTDLMLRRFASSGTAALQDRAASGLEAVSPLARPQLSVADSPAPAGNAVAALSLLRLAELTGEDRSRAAALAILEAFAEAATRLGSSAATYAKALAWAHREPVQVIVVGRGTVGRDLLDVALRTYRPRLTIRWLEVDDVGREPLLPHLAAMVDGSWPRAYVCRGRSCLPPVSEPARLQALLATEASA